LGKVINLKFLKVIVNLITYKKDLYNTDN